jgi:predicted ATP-dependent protease
VRAVREQDKATRVRLQELDRQVAAFTIGHLVDELEHKYAECPEVAEYLEEVRQDIITHVEEFKSEEEGEGDGGQVPIGPDGAQPELSLRYLVNMLVDNSEQSGAPVVIELNPTFNNLMGRIEHDVRFGSTVTDFTMLRPGAIHRANGGYLVLRARDLLNDRDAYEALKRALANEKAIIEERGAQAGPVSTMTLEPEPIPLEIKVVLLGSPGLYYLLYASDEDLRQLFKVKADFAIDMERTPDNELAYALFIRARCVEEGLRDFDASGVAAIVELGSRHAEHQGKLSTRFGDVADIIREANYWAGEAGHEQVTGEEVLRAMEEWRYRSNQVEERLRRLMLDGELMIDTQSQVTGQVNGLTVNSVGDYDFGQPSRITARTFAGSRGLVAIEREVKMSGRIHDKGVLILQGYLGGQYAASRPLALSASLGFEQLYNDVEGDSASSAELYALLSSLADLPVKQGIAVTGSVNQWGDIQPIGGAQYKVEGFFDLCAARGLDGEQGVIIPYQNAHHLMLRSDVVEAVAAGRFHVWAVHTIDEGIELLTGVAAGTRGPDGQYPPDSIHGRVEARLQALAEAAEKRKNDRPGENKQEPEPDEEPDEEIDGVPGDVPPDGVPGDVPPDGVPGDVPPDDGDFPDDEA